MKRLGKKLIMVFAVVPVVFVAWQVLVLTLLTLVMLMIRF